MYPGGQFTKNFVHNYRPSEFNSNLPSCFVPGYLVFSCLRREDAAPTVAEVETEIRDHVAVLWWHNLMTLIFLDTPLTKNTIPSCSTSTTINNQLSDSRN